MNKVRLTIYGNPIPKQSARFYKNDKGIRSFQPKEITNTKLTTQIQIKTQLKRTHVASKEEVVIDELRFIYAPPKSIKANERKIIESGGLVKKKTKPDLDNLQKFIFDCLNGLVFYDDGQIAEINKIGKYYGKTPCTIISLSINEVV